VIVNPQGYILTARHLVDPRWTRIAYDSTLDSNQKDLYDNATLDHCEVGLPENISLPSAENIRAFSPSTLITTDFQYSVAPYFLPAQNGMSDREYQSADFAVLKITGATPSCASANQNCSLSNNFPYTPVATGNTLPRQNSDQIFNYGYPAETNINHEGNDFYKFYLKGAVGTIGTYINGDQRFSNQPMSFSFEAQDIQDGRSGSPIFWNGYVIGILYGSTSTEESYNLAMPIIAAILHDANLDWVLTK
jgi:hypothetical protein